MKVIKLFFYLFICLLLFNNCFKSSFYHNAHLGNINKNIASGGPIQIMLIDGSEYNINLTAMDSTMIIGNGEVKKFGYNTWEQFSDTIPLENIEFVAIRENDFLKNVLIYGSAITLTTLFSQDLQGPEGPKDPTLTADVIYTGPGGGGSCPYIYSWNGDNYTLEAEAFGIAFGKALEIETRHVLPSLKPEDSFVKIQIANERPETHYINSVELYAIESEISTIPVFDSENTPWPVNSTVSPVTAKDHLGNTVLSKVETVDEKYWKSDLSNTSVFSNFEDIIDLTFNRSDSISDGSLVIHGINTKFSNIVFENIFAFLGDQSLAFMQAVENDQELIKILQDWIVESSIKSFIWNGNEWEKVGIIYPEANEVPFSRLIRFNIPDNGSDQVKIRLICLADVWKIDAIQMSWGSTEPLKSRTVPLILALGSDGKEKISLLSNADDKYAILLPPEKIDLKFKALTPIPGKKITYALSAQGYLHEWIPQKTSQSSFSMFTNLIQDSKIDYLKYLLKHKNIFLPPVYADWKKCKSEMGEIF